MARDAAAEGRARLDGRSQDSSTNRRDPSTNRRSQDRCGGTKEAVVSPGEQPRDDGARMSRAEHEVSETIPSTALLPLPPRCNIHTHWDVFSKLDYV